MGLTAEQRKVLKIADKFGVITAKDEEVCPGIHFCMDWDQLPVCDDSPEADACTCGLLTTTPKGEG